MKRYKDWKGNLDEFLQVGDEVDEAMVDYIIEVLPPAKIFKGFVQMGEAYSHVYDHISRKTKPTYYTFYKTDVWRYYGKCFLSQTVEP